MVVYGELLFIENAVIGAALLYLTGNICGVTFGGRAAKLRLLGGSLMCGAFSLVIFIDAKGTVLVLMELFFAVAVCMLAFGCQGRGFGKQVRGFSSLARVFIRREVIVFILVTYFMGGITMGLLLLTQQQGIYTAAGIYTGDMKAAMLAIFIMLGYMTVRQTIKTIRTIKLYDEHSYLVKLKAGGCELTTRGFLDTGNHLRDPISGKPVSVASENLWQRMKTGGLVSENKLALIPYETVGGKGMLEAVRVNHAELASEPLPGHEGCSEMKIDGFIVARNPGEFHMGREDGMTDTDGVTGPDMMPNGGGYELLLSGNIKGSIF